MPPLTSLSSYENDLYLLRLNFLKAKKNFEKNKKIFEDNYFDPNIKHFKKLSFDSKHFSNSIQYLKKIISDRNYDNTDLKEVRENFDDFINELNSLQKNYSAVNATKFNPGIDTTHFIILNNFINDFLQPLKFLIKKQEIQSPEVKNQPDKDFYTLWQNYFHSSNALKWPILSGSDELEKKITIEWKKIHNLLVKIINYNPSLPIPSDILSLSSTNSAAVTDLKSSISNLASHLNSLFDKPSIIGVLTVIGIEEKLYNWVENALVILKNGSQTKSKKIFDKVESDYDQLDKYIEKVKSAISTISNTTSEKKCNLKESGEVEGCEDLAKSSITPYPFKISEKMPFEGVFFNREKFLSIMISATNFIDEVAGKYSNNHNYEALSNNIFRKHYNHYAQSTIDYANDIKAYFNQIHSNQDKLIIRSIKEDTIPKILEINSDVNKAIKDALGKIRFLDHADHDMTGIFPIVASQEELSNKTQALADCLNSSECKMENPDYMPLL